MTSWREIASERSGSLERKNSMYKNSTQRIWVDMMYRCYRKKNTDFKYYGGRGIAVCRSWHTFADFFLDMGHPPSSDHTLERIDCNADYSKSNCRWATRSEQSRNLRRNRFVFYAGEKLTITDAAIKSGLGKDTIRYRLNSGWPESELFTSPYSFRL